MLENIQRQLAQLAPKRMIDFLPDANLRTASITVLGNEDALKQVLLILLDNAVKHTPPSARITVSVDAVDSVAQICVSDIGPSIAGTALDRIFDRFYVVDASRTQNSTGLGLSVAKTLVESRNGEICVVSHADKGTTFKVELPCQHT